MTMLPAAVRAVVDSMLRELRVCEPARVEAYDPTRFRIDAQPLLRRGRIREDGVRVADRAPVVLDVPLVFPGSGGARLRWPVRRGDTVLLVYADRALDRWLNRGGELDPGDDRGHAITDAIAIPGLLSFAEASDAAPLIEFTEDGRILAGGTAELATKADLEALREWIATHVHPDPSSGFTGAPSTPPPSPAGTSTLRGA